MLRRTSHIVIVLTIALSASGAERYVTPNGDPDGPGTYSRPWPLERALTGASPGDVVWIRGGTYRTYFYCKSSGTPERPIIFRAYPGERVLIDGGSAAQPPITVEGSNVWLWGLEVMFSNPTRFSRQSGSNPAGLERRIGVFTSQSAGRPVNVKFINMVIHDTGGGFGVWKEAANAEIYGNLVFYDGWDAPDRGHGHGIYTQNATAGVTRIEDNILFGAFSHGLHVFSSEDFMQNYVIEGNVAFDNGKLSSTTGYATNFRVGAGADIPRNITFQNNYSYYTPSRSGGDNVLGSTAGCQNMTVAGNVLVAENGTALNKPFLCTSVSLRDNTFVGPVRGIDRSLYPDNVYHDRRPTGTNVFIRPNRYEPGRAHIIVFNWDRHTNVSVDLSSVLRKGDGFEIRDAQNYFGGPVLKGTFDGSKLNLPMSLTSVAQPVGETPVQPEHTDSTFGVFILSVPSRATDFLKRRPSVSSNGVAHAADLLQRTIAPGCLFSIFGTDLSVYTASASPFPLATSLGGASVTINGVPAPMLYASSNQLNAQVPNEITAGRASLVVNVSDNASEQVEITIDENAPGIFSDNNRHAIAHGADGLLNDTNQPARPGSMLIVYLTGFGQVTPDVPAGTAAPADPLAVPVSPVQVTIGGLPATLTFAGLTPGQAGVGQINMVVPDLPTGIHEIRVAAGNHTSAPVHIAVQR